MKLVETDFETDRRQQRLAEFQAGAPQPVVNLLDNSPDLLGEWIGQAQEQVAACVEKTEKEIRESEVNQ